MLKRSLRLYPPHPLWNALPIVQQASVPILEMWRLGRDTIMYPPVQVVPGADIVLMEEIILNEPYTKLRVAFFFLA